AGRREIGVVERLRLLGLGDGRRALGNGWRTLGNGRRRGGSGGSPRRRAGWRRARRSGGRSLRALAGTRASLLIRAPPWGGVGVGSLGRALGHREILVRAGLG